MRNARKAITRTLLELARSDASIFVLCTDSRGSVTIGDFAKELPNQFVECGIAEQNAVGIGAGLANAGVKPFVCGPACFFSMRAAEQVKVDMAYSNMNVKVIGVSGGVSYGALGTTHHATQDVALMRAIPNMTVILPADHAQAAAMTRALAHHIGPVYVRVGRGDVADVYEDGAPFEIGKANWLRRGSDVSLIATGEMVSRAVEAAKLLAAQDVSASVLDVHTLKPFDEAAVLEAAVTRAVVTLEEHAVAGGLGGAVAELLCQRKPTKMKILGLPVEPLYNGAAQAVFDHYGLTAQGAAAAAVQLIGKG
jgi:transketolase